MDSVVVRQVVTRRDRRQFMTLPWHLYRDDANWVPPLRLRQTELLGWRRHPFYDRARIATFLASRGDRVVGRIAAIVNDAHNQRYAERRGFFGFFECVDEQPVADALFDAACRWLGEQGMTCMRGPVNPSMNYECALLIDGFDSPPCFMMSYNRPYYARLIEACGLTKAHDLYAFTGSMDLLPPLIERFEPAVTALLRDTRLTVRSIDTGRFLREVETYLDVYNRSLDATWGFVPFSRAELQHAARSLRHLIVPEFTAVGEVDGQPIGAVFFLLDYNPLIKRIDGRLFPFGWLTLMRRRRSLRSVRALTTTMMPGYQRSGASLLVMQHLITPARAWPIETGEFSWVLESNTLACGSLRRGGLEISKTYRIYDRPDLDPTTS